MGTALSPNGLGMAEEGMLSLSHVDQVLAIDPQKQTVTVQAGARVSQVRGEAWLARLDMQIRYCGLVGR